MKKVVIFSALAAVLMMSGCSDKSKPAQVEAAKPLQTEEAIGLRKTTLYSEQETLPSKTEYATNTPGSGVKYERAFDNAPPMIPHDTEGMLPITREDNQCIACHSPEVAESMGATPIPKSHFASFRPKSELDKEGNLIQDGKQVAGTNDIKTVVHKLDELHKGRFNCSACHAPQNVGDPLVKNNFNPDYQSDTMKNRSNLLDTLNTGVN